MVLILFDPNTCIVYCILFCFLLFLYVANLLGLPLIPPNSQASGEAALHGVNYASAASGILDVTGQNFVSYI